MKRPQVVITLVLLGKNLEHGAKGRASEAIRSLLFTPRTATIVRERLRRQFP